MAQSKNGRVKSGGKKEEYNYPSRFGSHSSMIVEEHDWSLQPGEVLLEDEYGQYVTTTSRLDNGFNDPNRTNGNLRPRILKG